MSLEEEILKEGQGKKLFYTKVNPVSNVENDVWIRPWHLEKFDDLYNRDDRFFAVVMKGLLVWLEQNIVMYNKPIRHFIFNTGSAYMYIESDGYEFSWCETTGEDQMYMHLPRCLVSMGSISIPMEELTQPFARANYERRSGDLINAYNADCRRVPIEWSVTLKYALANFNESIILVQELIDKIVFQKYFEISYLGQLIQCSIEFPADFSIDLNEIDMESTDAIKKTIEIEMKICTSYPLIDERSEIKADRIISAFGYGVHMYKGNPENNESTVTDVESKKIDETN